MNNQTPAQFISTLQTLADNAVRNQPEFIFMVALKNQLLENQFDSEISHRLASQHTIALPVGATAEQLEDMAYHVAILIAKCHDDLQSQGGYCGPSDEAALLAEKLIRAALS